jgi:hypothetical protein
VDEEAVVEQVVVGVTDEEAVVEQVVVGVMDGKVEL